MTPTAPDSLTRHLADLIQVQGPIPMSVYMAEALGHPDLGYYMTREPIGRDGDFITAPEVSQIFGELIGIWCVDIWQRMGSPPSFCLTELGPGKGTLMIDLVRALSAMPGVAEAAHIHMIETSPSLADQQRKNLDRAGIAGARWHQRLADIPRGPLIVVANEFFDALPVRQYVRTERGWHERLVDWDPAAECFRFVLAARPAADPEAVPQELKHAPEDEVVESCPAAQALVSDLAERLVKDDGAVLVIDYGSAESATGDSLQAVSGHATHPVLDRPGEADLTAHVDFAALAKAGQAAGAAAHGPVTQGSFLQALGIDLRAAALSEHATPAQQHDLQTAVERLCAPEQMGELFKALAFTRADHLPPAGFEAAS